MADYSGLIPKIHKAEAHLKALRATLEKETGLKEDEGVLLDYMETNRVWAEDRELVGKVFHHSKTYTTLSALRRKGYVDVEQGKRMRRKMRINEDGRKALTRFKEQLFEK